MKIVKGFALVLLSLILVLALCAFGLAFTVNRVILQPDEVEKIVNNINFAQAIQEQIDKQNTSGDISPQLESAIVGTIQNIEPVIKQQVDAAIKNTYVYLKSQGSAPDLRQTLNNSVMNTTFAADVLDKVDLSQLLNQAVQEQAGSGTNYSAAFVNALVNAVDATEPEIKAQIVNACDPIFKYLLTQAPTLDLKSTLRQTVLSDNAASEVLDNFDYAAMTKNILLVYIGGTLPEGITLSDAEINTVTAALQPSIKTAFAGAAGDFANYLTGADAAFSVGVPLQPALQSLKTVAREAFFAQLPPELQGESQADLENDYQQFYNSLTAAIPAVYTVDSTDLGINTTADITNAITDAQNSLTTARNNIDTASQNYTTDLQNARPYVKDFQIGFTGLIVLIILLILCIILIYHNVKDSCRDLGSVFLIYGAIEFAGVLIIKNIANAQIAKANIPQAFNNIPGMALNDIIAPLQIISLVCLSAGVVLIIVSFLYPRQKPAKAV
jgi:hypothetical protein